MRALDLSGKRFGRLVALDLDVSELRKSRSWRCMCDCGKELTVVTGALRGGNTQSCGCSRETSDEDKMYVVHRREYATWGAMRFRCLNSNDKEWHRYGGRGNSICPEWNDFSVFLQDLGCAPVGCSLERRNNDGNYDPGNCEWATKLEQANNTSTNHFVEAFGERKTIANWLRDIRCKLKNSQTLGKRLKRGWVAEDAISKPTREAAEIHAKALLSFTTFN